MDRRLAAILLTDIVGYSRLIGLDEEGTIARQRAHREEIIDPTISAFGGRIVKTTGDGLLVEFPSVVDAVKCAVEAQTELIERDNDVPEDRRIQYRIGINLGDIVIDGDDILGDGVNIAARIEGLAKPGGICISGTVYDHLAGKVDAIFEEAGEQIVKNVPRPVRVWHWQADQLARSLKLVTDPTQLDDIPGIAVLPFKNMSDDPDQEYFADGITEDIITELSRYRSMTVIARNSTFAYKGRSVAVSHIGRELGVQFVLEGSIRKAGNQIRVTAQLVDVERGDHLWAERFDRQLQDIFAVQDEITQIVAGTLGPKMQTVRTERIMKENPARLGAYDLVLRALGHWHLFTEEDHAETARLVQAAIDIDPSYSRAYSVLAMNLSQSRNSGYLGDYGGNLQDALKAARKAVSLDDNDAQAHVALALVCLFSEQHEQAIAECCRAIELNPNFADAHARLANVLSFSGQVEEALAELEIAMRLNPHYPSFYLLIMGRSLILKGDHSAAIAPLERAVNISPGLTPARTTLAASYWAAGRKHDAKSQIKELLFEAPTLTLAHVRSVTPIKNDQTRQRFLEYLHQAGLPD